ncbi:minor capsid protein [Macrococcoides canis]|uniref:putative minor capsid protein n=1 Tax=Macrococcoides canis TaxID=1855823 RepID=UPI001F288D02|nr:putative minor capsid protein [Macrococcus canis]UJS28483.1 minor capsid protein [Macrococcus canis]
MTQLPLSFLIHEMEYHEFYGSDSWDTDLYREPVTVKNIRFDETTVYSKDLTERKIVANGVVFVDGFHSTPIPDFKEESKVYINGKKYIIVKVIPCYQPQSNTIHHYELEVV